MSAALAFNPKNRVRIFRAEDRPAGKVAFQREWEPVFCPQMPSREEAESRANTAQTGSRSKPKRIPPRYYSGVASVALTLIMTGIITFWAAVQNNGLTLNAGALWLTTWPVSAVIAVPMRLLLAPLVSKAVGLVVEAPVQPH
jgi:hypothetical protein